MFGIVGDIASKAFGGVLDAMGFGELKPLLSTAIDIFTGDWLGAAEGLTGIAASISEGSEARQSGGGSAPLADAFSASGGGAQDANPAGAAGGFDDVIRNLVNTPDVFGRNGGGDSVLNAANVANAFVGDAGSISGRRAAAAAV